METPKYSPKNKIRIVTAAALFDGHDAAINIMRRVIQGTGVEVIHLGHDKSAEEVVNCAIQEDANAIALTSYQGGHNEYFKYIYDLLKEKNASHIKIFGGGGGVILPEEIKDLMEYGVTRIYSPDDGRELGLQGMIDDLVQKSDFPTGEKITNNNFTGNAWLQPLINADNDNQNSVGNVTFAPGARSKWHLHPAGQILLVIDGVGYYQEKGQPKKILRKGDAIKCPPNVPHWHGASANESFTQLAITGREKGETIWLEPVTDEEYNN